MNEMLEVIQTIGFPMAISVFCIYYIVSINKEYRTDTISREERLYKQISDITNTLSEVNKSLILINERLEKVEVNGHNE